MCVVGRLGGLVCVCVCVRACVCHGVCSLSSSGSKERGTWGEVCNERETWEGDLSSG